MNRIYLPLLTCLAALLTVTPAQARSFAKIRESGVLRVAVPGDLPPFNFDANGLLVTPSGAAGSPSVPSGCSCRRAGSPPVGSACRLSMVAAADRGVPGGSAVGPPPARAASESEAAQGVLWATAHSVVSEGRHATHAHDCVRLARSRPRYKRTRLCPPRS